jgi:hypothetical protein
MPDPNLVRCSECELLWQRCLAVRLCERHAPTVSVGHVVHEDTMGVGIGGGASLLFHPPCSLLFLSRTCSLHLAHLSAQLSDLTDLRNRGAESLPLKMSAGRCARRSPMRGQTATIHVSGMTLTGAGMFSPHPSHRMMKSQIRASGRVPHGNQYRRTRGEYDPQTIRL